MSRGRWLAALALGSFLAATPFLRYAHLGESLVPHADHAPRHGGRLQMVGDHHLELVRGPTGIELFVSDALRQPVQPVRGEVRLDDGPPLPLRWENHRLRAEGDVRAAAVDVAVELEGGVRLAWRFEAQ